MVSFFKRAHPINFLALMVIGLALWSFAFLKPSYFAIAFSSMMPFYEVIVEWIIRLDVPALTTLIPLVLVIIEALLINKLVTDYEFLGKGTYLPALIYIVIMSSGPDMLTLHPLLFSNLFLIIGFRKLLSIYREENVLKEVFDCGLLISIASLFYFPAVVFFLLIWIGLLILRPFNWREWVLSLFGFLVPYYLVGFIYFWNDKLDYFLLDKIVYPIANRQITLTIDPHYYPVIVLLVLILMFSVRRLFTGLSKNTVRSRKYLFVMIWFFLFSLLSLLLAPTFAIYNFAFLAIPLSIYFVNYFISNKYKWWPDVIFLLIVGSIVFVQMRGG